MTLRVQPPTPLRLQGFVLPQQPCLTIVFLTFVFVLKNVTPPCPNTGLSKHGDPVFPHFLAFFGTIIFAVPIHLRMWFVAFVQAAGRVNMRVKVLV